MHVRFETNPSYLNQNFLLDGILKQAKQHGFLPHVRFAFFLYDDQNNIHGGIKGSNFYGSLYIDYIYVEPSLRGNGYGREFLVNAESWGIAQGCNFSTLTTMSFEAKDFYLKCGYTIEFEQTGYHNDARMIYLRKLLEPVS